MSEKPKPCPFCGSENVELERQGTGRQSNIVRCQYCGASRESGITFDYFSDWDDRPIEDKLRAENETLRNIVRHYGLMSDAHLDQVIDRLGQNAPKKAAQAGEGNDDRSV